MKTLKPMVIKSSNPIIWLRWLLILPVSISFPIFIDWLVRLFFYLSLDSRVETGIARCLIMLISTIGSVLLAYIVAPSSKFEASIIIAAVWVLVLAACLIIVVGGIEIAGEQQTVLDGGVSSISMLVGLTIGLLITNKLRSRSDQVEHEFINSIQP